MFFYVETSDIEAADQDLAARFDNAKAVKGTQKLHRIVPENTSKAKAYDYSSQSAPPVLITVCHQDEEDIEEIICPTISDIAPVSGFAAYIYDDQWWIGLTG